MQAGYGEGHLNILSSERTPRIGASSGSPGLLQPILYIYMLLGPSLYISTIISLFLCQTATPPLPLSPVKMQHIHAKLETLSPCPALHRVNPYQTDPY